MSDASVRAVRLPGHEGRFDEPLLTQFDELVGTLSHELAVFVRGRFALFGHSMGALLAFELARKVTAQRGSGPMHLFVSGQRGPHMPSRQPSVHTADDTTFLEYLRFLNGLPPDLVEHRELLDIYLPILRADFGVVESYKFVEGPPLECPITVFGGTHDPLATRDELEGWSVHTTGPFSVQMVEGDHFFVNSARQQLLAEVHRSLRAARR